MQTKVYPNAPNTWGVSIILVMEISLQDMSYKSRHKKFQHSFLKKKLSSKSQAEEKKWGKHPRLFMGFSSTPWASFGIEKSSIRKKQEFGSFFVPSKLLHIEKSSNGAKRKNVEFGPNYEFRTMPKLNIFFAPS
jgi:hypothetical protein